MTGTAPATQRNPRLLGPVGAGGGGGSRSTSRILLAPKRDASPRPAPSLCGGLNWADGGRGGGGQCCGRV